MCNCTSENPRIPRCAIAHLRSGPSDHPGMTWREAYKSHNSGYRVRPISTGFSMRFNVPTFCLALTLATLTLAACAKRNELPVNTSLNEDDDTFCRANNVAAGSP